MKPLAIDLFCGLGGWTQGLLAEGYEVVGFDIERHDYGDGKRYPAQLVIQDVMTVCGAQFKDAQLIVASPPCQEYSYMAMPWSRAKAIAVEYRSGKRDVRKLTALFDACFRIQREASEAAGHHIPLIVENVRGAIPWVGRSRWNYGSFHLWGDVPALMPMTGAVKCSVDLNWNRKDGKPSLGFNTSTDALVHGRKVPGFRFDGSGGSFQTAAVKSTGPRHLSKGWRAKDYANTDKAALHHSDGTKQGGDWFGKDGEGSISRMCGSKSKARKARKAASAAIAMIPLGLSRHIAMVYR